MTDEERKQAYHILNHKGLYECAGYLIGEFGAVDGNQHLVDILQNRLDKYKPALPKEQDNPNESFSEQFAVAMGNSQIRPLERNQFNAAFEGQSYYRSPNSHTRGLVKSKIVVHGVLTCDDQVLLQLTEQVEVTVQE